MDHDSIENAIRSLLDEQNDVEDRILSARHLGTSRDVPSFEALRDVCREPEGDKKLFVATAKSLARVAEALGKTDDVDLDAMNEAAREAFEREV